MRTTIDLPDALHRQVQAIAQDTNRSMSATVSDLLRRALVGSAQQLTTSPVTGLPITTVGAAVTAEDARALDDE